MSNVDGVSRRCNKKKKKEKKRKKKRIGYRLAAKGQSNE
jgi:hypothetical protein